LSERKKKITHCRAVIIGGIAGFGMATAKAASAEEGFGHCRLKQKDQCRPNFGRKVPPHAPSLGFCETLIPEFVREQYMSGTVKFFGCASDLPI
jgi:hypothetical protein